MKVLIIGGYGTFGFGMAERLSDEAGLELILAGRNFEKAKAACDRLSGAATFTPLKLDRNALALDFKPDLIVDTSGPFQAYDAAPVLDYCEAQQIHYADISDDGAFVKTVCARENNDIILVSGLSTCPVLSAIGLREIEEHIGPAERVAIGIAPSPKAELGRNVVAAVANYAGQTTVPVRRESNTVHVAGITDIRDETICAPGGLPLPPLPFAVADAPDALALPQSFPELTDIWTGVGTRPVWLHLILVQLSRLIARSSKASVAKFAGFFHWSRGLFKYGAHRGGMFVRAANQTGEASWHLIAEGDHGPRIPALPVVALIRKMLRGEAVPTGAYSGDEIIGLDDLAPEFAKLDITYGLQFDGAETPVYEKIMGEAYARFHPAIAELHRTGDKVRIFKGQCDVTRGRNPLSHIVAAVMGFPRSGKSVPVTVTVTPDAAGETWERNFDGKKFSSHHSLGTGKWARHITERFGPIRMQMAILEEDGKLRIDTRGWSLFGLLLPRFLKPAGDVYETQDEQGRFVFHVDLKAPLFGRLCKYHGWLEPIEKAGAKEISPVDNGSPQTRA